MAPPTRKICLNMIVKNEADKIEKCLSAVADYISCWVIGDTGSTDGTQDIISNFFRSRALPGELHSFPFRTFDQARNAALDLARDSRLDYDYILFVDADMELVVDDQDFARKLTPTSTKSCRHPAWPTGTAACCGAAPRHGTSASPTNI